MSKKLKQACLPFKLLGTKCEKGSLPTEVRAQKGSLPSEARAQKRKNPEEQCTIDSKIAKSDIIVLSDEDDISKEKSDISKENKIIIASETVETNAQNEANDSHCNESVDKNDDNQTSEDEITVLEDPELLSGSCDNSEEPSPTTSPKTNKENTSVTETQESLSENDDAVVSILSPNSANSSIMNSSGTTTPKTKMRNSLKVSAASEERKKKILEEKQKRQREREEANLKKEHMKQEKLKQKEEKLRQRQQQHEAKLEEKRKKDEERKVKEEQKRQREDEKKKKDEDKRRKDEEKRNREEEKRKADEELTKKKEKEKQAFVSFFVKKDSTSSTAENVAQPEMYFRPFPVKENMKLAPVCRVSSDKLAALKPALDTVLDSQSTPRNYLEELKNKCIVPGRCEKTWRDNDLDVEIITPNGNKPAHTYKAKLLQFCENTRPPYWGTWLKKSKVINPRNPLKKDDDFFDYEIDSDDEWEEEEEAGESLANTDDEKESEDDYEVDNDVFVPHGYLSDEEAQNEDEMTDSPDTMKLKLRLMEQEFQKELKNQCKKLTPRVFGCVWADDDRPGIEELRKVLSEYAAVPLVTIPIDVKVCSGKVTEDNEVTPTKSKSDTLFGSAKGVVPDDAMPHLIRMLHGNTNGKDRLLPEFLAFWNKPISAVKSKGDADSGSAPSRSKISKRQLKITVQQIATWGKFPEPGPLFGKFCYFVKDEIRSKFDLAQLQVPNTWTCVTSQTIKPKCKMNKITTLLGTSVDKNSTEQSVAEDVAISNDHCEIIA